MWLVDLIQRPRHNERVRRSAGLSAVNLKCHVDTWSFVLRLMSEWLKDGYRWTEDPSDAIAVAGGDLIQVRLSGARLAELMSTLWHVPNGRRGDILRPVGMTSSYTKQSTPAECEHAARLYQAISTMLNRVQADTPRQGDFPTITIDDAVAEGTA